MRDISNKERIIKLKEIFEKETDEYNELSFEDIIDRLQLEYGADYEVGLKAIKDDIKTLDNAGYCLIENQDKYGKKLFSKQNRQFEPYELRIIIDAICSARFIDSNKLDKLIAKIKGLTSKGLANKMANQIYIGDKVVCENKGLRFNIDKLHNAIQQNRVIEFKYGRYNINKEFIENHNGQFYEAEPYGLVWNNGFYYLVALNLVTKKIVNYRVDRMRAVNIGERTFVMEYFDIAEYTDRCFNMYPGEICLIKIKFDNHLINSIIDRFGKDVRIEKAGENNFTISINAALTKGLVRWILNWGSDAEVIQPQILIEQIKEETGKMYGLYQDK